MKKRMICFAAVILMVCVFPQMCVFADENGYTVNSSGGDIAFTLEITDCTEGEFDGKIKCTLKRPDPDDTYSVSFNGGKSYRDIPEDSFTLNGMKPGSYAISVRKNNDDGTASALYSVYVGDGSGKTDIDFYVKAFGGDMYGKGEIRLFISNAGNGRKYEYSIDGGENWKSMDGKSLLLKGVNAGKYRAMIRERFTAEQSPVIVVNVPEIELNGSAWVDADMIMQNPELPTGCEITTLTMLLNHIGFDVDKETMAVEYLPKGEYRASDFRKVFVGDPHSIYAYGCYSSAIVTAAEKYLEDSDEGDEWEIFNITGCTADSLYAAVDNGNPVAVWATIDMNKPYTGRSWKVKETGETVTWTAQEHCLLLTGYDVEKQVVYTNDPMRGETEYDMELFEKRFRQLGSQAVLIIKD